MRCIRCGNQVPDGPYCTRCGAPQSAGPEGPGTRYHSYAAHPGEHVFHLAAISTLLPHLGRHKVHEFRLAFGAGVVILFLLVAGGLISTAILVAAFLVPVLYLLFLYEAQVYRDEPLPVLGHTLGAGIVLGWIVT